MSIFPGHFFSRRFCSSPLKLAHCIRARMTSVEAVAAAVAVVAAVAVAVVAVEAMNMCPGT